MTARVASVRHQLEVPIKLSLVPNGNTGKLDASKDLYVCGETCDVSSSGIAFIVASIRIKENYLVGEGRALHAELDLPNGKISMKIIGRRYEQVGEHISTARYVIGASIEEISAENREAYDDFLRFGKRKGNTGSLKFGIDES